MRIDLIIPTFRRPSSLLVLLSSLSSQHVPEGICPVIHVADNNSGDDTPRVVTEFARTSPIEVRYHLVLPQGRSSAINHVAQQSAADWLAFIDDDEEAWSGWLSSLTTAIRESGADYYGGPCVPRFLAPRPEWMPAGWPAVIGDVPGPAVPTDYSELTDAMFMGGNGAIRRALFARLGGYSSGLGRSGNTRLMSCEDRDLDHRLRLAGACGVWLPGMTVWHDVPASRLQPEYFRRWAFDHGMSLMFYRRMSRSGEPRALLGVPLWRWRVSMSAALELITALLKPSFMPGEKLRLELSLREHAGMLAGRFVKLPTVGWPPKPFIEVEGQVVEAETISAPVPRHPS